MAMLGQGGWRCRGAVVLAAALAAGCMRLGNFRADVAASREAAIAAWERARAGEPDGTRPSIRGELSLEAAQVLAMGNNKQLLAALQEKLFASGRLTEAWAALYPTATLTGSYRRVDEVSGFTIGPQKVTIGGLDNYAFNLALQQPVFSGGAIQSGIRAARVYALIADEGVRSAVQAILFQVRKAYYDVLLAAELARVSESDLELAKRHLADVEKKLKAGTAREYDVLRARVEITNVEAELITRQDAERLATAQLLRHLGVAQDSDVSLTGKLAHEPVSPELAGAVAAAFRRRPELLLAELAIRAQNEALRGARAGWFPFLSLFANATYTKPDPHDAMRNKWGDAWDAGASLAWTLFDGFRTTGRVRQERARLRQAEIALLDAEEQVLLEIQQALLSIEDAEKLVRSQSANIERAREGLRLAEVGYKAGAATEIEVLDARQALSRTQALFYQALYAHTMARLLLEKATGALEQPAEGAPK